MKRYLLSRNTACLGGLLVVIVVGGVDVRLWRGRPQASAGGSGSVACTRDPSAAREIIGIEQATLEGDWSVLDEYGGLQAALKRSDELKILIHSAAAGRPSTAMPPMQSVAEVVISSKRR